MRHTRLQDSLCMQSGEVVLSSVAFPLALQTWLPGSQQVDGRRSSRNRSALIRQAWKGWVGQGEAMAHTDSTAGCFAGRFQGLIWALLRHSQPSTKLGEDQALLMGTPAPPLPKTSTVHLACGLCLCGPNCLELGCIGSGFADLTSAGDGRNQAKYSLACCSTSDRTS